MTNKTQNAAYDEDLETGAPYGKSNPRKMGHGGKVDPSICKTSRQKREPGSKSRPDGSRTHGKV